MAAVVRFPARSSSAPLLAPWRPNWYAIRVAAGMIAVSLLGWWGFAAFSSAAFHAAHLTLEMLFHAH